MSLTHRKVVIRRLNGDLSWGYLPGSGFCEGGVVQVMDPAGKAISLSISEIATIAYVKDFNTGDRLDPERMGRRSFTSRPRGEGVWMRLTFPDGETIEGLAGFDVALLDAAREDGGLFFTPPDARGNTIRLFVPRTAIARLELLGAVLPPAPKPDRRRSSAESAQESLFER